MLCWFLSDQCCSHAAASFLCGAGSLYISRLDISVLVGVDLKGHGGRTRRLVKQMPVLLQPGAKFHHPIVDIHARLPTKVRLGLPDVAYVHALIARSPLIEREWQSGAEMQLEEVDQFEGTPSERLFRWMEILTLGEQARYEVAVRAWAGFDKMAAEVVRGTDKRRIKWLRRAFQEMGFTGNEAEMRARLFVYYQLAEPSVLWREPKSKRREIMKLRHKLLTSPVPA